MAHSFQAPHEAFADALLIQLCEGVSPQILGDHLKSGHT